MYIHILFLNVNYIIFLSNTLSLILVFFPFCWEIFQGVHLRQIWLDLLMLIVLFLLLYLVSNPDFFIFLFRDCGRRDWIRNCMAWRVWNPACRTISRCNVCVCICMCVYIYRCTCMRERGGRDMFVYLFTYICIYHIRVWIHVYIHIFLYRWMYIYVYVYIFVCVYMYI